MSGAGTVGAMEQDQCGEYGYDADEMRIALSTPAWRRVRRPVQGTFGPERGLDPDGDFGYDEAHDL